MRELLRLFKVVEVTKSGTKNPSKKLAEKTIQHSYVFSPEVIFSNSVKKLEELSIIVEEEIGLSSGQVNSTFHKSWSKVKDADILQLLFEQMVHYFTTYGFEDLGIYNEESVYIPNEYLDIPSIDAKQFPLTVIHGCTKEEIKQKLFTLMGSGIALEQKTVEDIVAVAKYVGISSADIDKIRNKEVAMVLSDYLGLLPSKPEEFLRYAIHKATGRTLLIKDAATIELIKISTELHQVSLLFQAYGREYGLEKLSRIFLRFKPLFLAFKSERSMRPVINKLRKLAVKYHVPMKQDFLNNITANIKQGISISEEKLLEELSKVNVFRKIRLAYALKYRTADVESILYRIRNGKGFVTDFFFENREEANRIFDIVYQSIVNDVKNKVHGQMIYIPTGIRYTLPATEKQFTGYFPSGTYISTPSDIIFGIHWHDVDGHRIDLDLSLMNDTYGKIGWDGSYRVDDGAILFSGDMTSAGGKHGASELFYVKRQVNQELIMFVNYYNFRDDVEVPFDIVVAQEHLNMLKKNYMIDPNSMKASAKTNISRRQKVLGLIRTTSRECRFYFCGADVGVSITVGNNEYVRHTVSYLSSFYRNMISLNDVFIQAGAKLVDGVDDATIDLSPNTLGKDTIISLL